MTQDLSKTLKSLNQNADWIGLRKVTSNKKVFTIRNGYPEYCGTHYDQGIMVEVLYQGQFGYCATANTALEGVRLAAQRAHSLAKIASEFKMFPFSLKHRPKVEGEYKTPVKQSFNSLSDADITDFLCLTSDEINKSRGIDNSMANIMLVDNSIEFVSTNGSVFHTQLNLISYQLSATAAKNGDSQSRTWSGNGQMGLEFMDQNLFKEKGKLISEQALELLQAPNCPEDTMDLIIDPDQMVLQVHESIGHPLEYDRILGDERNYAGWSFIKAQDFGKLKYGPEILNVTFDPTVPSELASYKIDDGGSLATKEYLIKSGILQRGLGGLESQERISLPGVSNFRSCSWNRAPIDRMANINVEPGVSSVDEMVSSVENGVFMHTNKSWSIDDYRNKFQFGCEYAQLIENGKLTKVVKNP
ncbi:MAG: TldD/PmbA family protein, partial [Bdellovibrionales bacterium]|nr:TldD/PmbA family protein [Bdellovibrionales bacterium]